ncbi:hypothetical protein Mgra_00000661 [Meloidogyne graminicola]|uniref:Uncharacterized protein n=1 Tax=Meloidogyne graminicola TaxID=189291 RepID=A0A8T0A2C4_9BILA|nr:hypothetical protein Mgra_00000661 [Meloidogyne graminicola]
MVGYSYIERIHTLGRGFHLGSLLTMLKLGRGDAGPDSARLLKQLHAGAYIPADLKLIPYIDQLLSQRPSIETVLPDNASGKGVTVQAVIPITSEGYGPFCCVQFWLLF